MGSDVCLPLFLGLHLGGELPAWDPGDTAIRGLVSGCRVCNCLEDVL